jgi:ABC-2 type transport system permease protein
MKKIWLVAKTVYRKHVRSGSFIMLTVGLPLIMIAVGGISIMVETRGDLPEVGYIDRTHLLTPLTRVYFEDKTLVLKPISSQEAAQNALSEGNIGGYLVIPEGYFQDQQSPVYYSQKSPNAVLEEGLKVFIREALTADYPAWVQERLRQPADFTYISQSTGEEISEGPGLIVRVAAPALLGLVFLLAVFTGASQLGTAVVEEKDHRAMEIVITSLTPRQLVIGKITGMALLTLTQVTVWVAGALIATVLLLSGSGTLRGIQIPWQALTWGVLLGIPGYFLYAVIAAGLGVLAGDKQQARQMAGMLGFLGMSPMYFMGALVNAMDSPLAVGLTLFPLTSTTISMFRMTLSEVPVWQLSVSFLILVLCLAVGILFLTRIFRAAMLMYGQALKPRQILQALRD